MRRYFLLTIIFISMCMITHCGSTNKKFKMLWIDATANFSRLNSKKSIITILDKIVEAGVDGIIVDVKPISGEVLYPSGIAPQLLTWKGFTRDKDFNYLGTILPEAHNRGLKTYIAINVFSEGWKEHRCGPVYWDHPEWATMIYTPEGIMPITEHSSGLAAFVNPAIPDVRDYEISIMEELVSNYPFDGIVLDRGRYNGINSDFSDLSRELFQRFLGFPIPRWPEDIFTWEKDENGEWKTVPEKFYKEWLLWRAGIIHDFFVEAKDRVKAINDELIFADYVGAWYPDYYAVGANWAVNTFDPSQRYNWAHSRYAETGYAQILDFLCTGCYFYEVKIEEVKKKKKAMLIERGEAGMTLSLDDWNSVEGAARMSMEVTRGVTPVYGSLYVQQYYDKDDPEQFVKAIRMCLQETNGIMVFDLCHLESFDWWKYLKEGLEKY